MSTFSDQFSSMGLPLLMDQLGETATYRAAGTVVDVALTAIKSRANADQAGDGRGRRLSSEILIATDPDGDYGGVAAPARGDKFTIGLEAWIVDRIMSIGGGFARLSVFKSGEYDG